MGSEFRVWLDALSVVSYNSSKSAATLTGQWFLVTWSGYSTVGCLHKFGDPGIIEWQGYVQASQCIDMSHCEPLKFNQ